MVGDGMRVWGMRLISCLRVPIQVPLATDCRVWSCALPTAQLSKIFHFTPAVAVKSIHYLLPVPTPTRVLLPCCALFSLYLCLSRTDAGRRRCSRIAKPRYSLSYRPSATPATRYTNSTPDINFHKSYHGIVLSSLKITKNG